MLYTYLDGARKETLWDIYGCGAPDRRWSWYVYWNGDDLKVVYQKWYFHAYSCAENGTVGYGIYVFIDMESLYQAWNPYKRCNRFAILFNLILTSFY